MKTLFASLMLLLLCISASSQEEVTFNFVRKKALSGAASTITVFLNDVEVIRLRNGSSYSYKTMIDTVKPVTVRVRSGVSRRETTFRVMGTVCDIQTGFSGGFLNVNLLSNARVEAGTGAVSGVDANKKDMSITYTSTRTLSSDTIRQQWLDVGGKIMGMSYIGGFTYMTMKGDGFLMTGMGGNFTITTTFLNFRVPEKKAGIQSWKSSVFGFTGTDQFFSSKLEFDDPMMAEFETSTFNINILFSLNAGYTLGLGKFKDETKWKGAAFELTYRPSVIISLPTNGGKSDVSANLGGFGFDINFNSFTSNASKLAPKAQSKITMFMLPPMDDKPFFISVGYGLTFYRKYM